MNPEMQGEQLDEWCLIDLFGHQRIAGKVTSVVLGGAPMFRVDVPEVGEDAAHTRYFGPAAIYSISPVSEEVARAMAATLRQRPVHAYELLRLKAPEGADGQPMERRGPNGESDWETRGGFDDADDEGQGYDDR